MTARPNHSADEDLLESWSRRAWTKAVASCATLLAIPGRSRWRFHARELDRNLNTSTEEGVYDVREFGARGDGKVDDRAACQRALDAAASRGGGTVRFPSGLYLIAKAGLSVGANIRIEGRGVLQVGGDFTGLLIQEGASNVDIEGLVLDASTVTSHERGNLIELAGENQFVEIRDCRLISAARSAIRLTRCIDVRITGNAIEAPFEHGIDVTAPANDLWVIDNVIRNAGSRYKGSGVHGKGISLAATLGVIRYINVVGNRIIDARDVSIELWSDDVEGHRCEMAVISGNEVRQSRITGTTIGISVAGSRAITAIGNRVEGGAIGLEIAYSKQVALIGNVSRGSTGTGISVSRSAAGSQTAPQDITIEGNVVIAPKRHGLEVIGAGTSGLIISGNVIEGSSDAPSARGIQLNTLGTASHFTVSDNLIRGFAGSGLYVVNSSDGILKGNLCRGNNVSRRGNEADIYVNMSNVDQQDSLTIVENLGELQRTFPARDSATQGLLAQGGLRKLTVTVSGTAAPYAHGLGYAPDKVLLTPHGPALVWQAAPSSRENVVLQSSTDSILVDVYVA